MLIVNADRFWHKLDELVAIYPVEIDRPRGSTHPRYGSRYPLYMAICRVCKLQTGVG